MKRGAASLLVGVVAAALLLGVVWRATAVDAVRVRAVPVLSDAEADALDDEADAASEAVTAASTTAPTAPAVAANANAAPADYHSVAQALDAHPEPVPPPQPRVGHRYNPAERAPASLVATAASAKSTVAAAGGATTAATAKASGAATATAASTAGATHAAATAAAHTAATSTASTVEAMTKYNEFLARNYRFAQSLTALFHEFDANHDGAIDLATELPARVADHTVTAQHANVIAAWDVNGDGKIQEKEWVMGPLYVSLLQYNPARKAEFERLVATGGDTSEITAIFARMAAGSADDLPRFAEMQIVPAATAQEGGKTEEELHLDAEQAQQELQAAAARAADDTARFAERHGRRRRRYKKRQAMSNKAARAAELLALKRPTSKHGIPSERDEHCVLCQYVVQRVQKQLYFTLSNSNDAFPADPNADVSAKKMRQVNSQLLNRRGGKGLLRILAEDVVSDMCEADSMPELYYSACRKIDKKFPVLLDAIYFQFHSEAVCEEAKLCGRSTYFNQPTSVHLPSKSIVYNSGRGKCGLMGGAHERANQFISAALCFAGSIFVESSAVTRAAL